jgi:hypothetical protein
MQEDRLKRFIDSLCELVGFDQFEDEVVVEGRCTGQRQAFPCVLFDYLIATELIKH